jgi:hypothetical protein
MVVFPSDDKAPDTFLPVVFLDAVGENIARWFGFAVHRPSSRPATKGLVIRCRWPGRRSRARDINLQ